jgi:hypothetical protein
MIGKLKLLSTACAYLTIFFFFFFDFDTPGEKSKQRVPERRCRTCHMKFRSNVNRKVVNLLDAIKQGPPPMSSRSKHTH